VPRADLAGLQRWFQGEILRPHATTRRAGPATKAKAVILPSRTLAPDERVAIYSRMYFLRLHDCLAQDYEAVKHILGDVEFERLVRGYLARYPSTHYSLNPLGTKLPSFLAGKVRFPKRALILDLARLELAMSQVFDAERSPVLSREDLERFPRARFGEARLRPIAAFQLLALDHRANAIVTAVRQERPLPPLGRKKTWVVVYRRDYQVWRMDLTEPMFAALSAFSAGRTLDQAIRAGAKKFVGSHEELLESVMRWFSEWREEGLFTAISL
jgi:hypothetical protein